MINAEESFNLEPNKENKKYLLFGSKGWIGGMIVKLLKENGCMFKESVNRLEDRNLIESEIIEFGATNVLCSAGKTGVPTVDWCESNRVCTIRSNIIGTLNLADVCDSLGVHCTIYGTGCIYSYNDSKDKFKEEDEYNFKESFYSYTKGFVDDMLKNYSNVLTLRIRMPISGDHNVKNFLSKITKYKSIHSLNNSMTVLFDLVPVSLVMATRGHTGIFNFCNPNTISHDECLTMHRDIIDNKFVWDNIDKGDLLKFGLIKVGRSNNELCCLKLINSVPDIYIPTIKDSVKEATIRRSRCSTI